MAPTAVRPAGPHPSAPTPKTFFGHPRGLATLFLTEMWERFSFYGMRALLPLYLIAGGPAAAAGSQGGGLAMTAPTALAITSLYLAMVYLPCVVGGWLGDRVWGPRRTVTVAACVMITGHVLLALPGVPNFFVGLLCVALGSGLLKANISTMVGHLYDAHDDRRRDGGFTVFYMGINLGGMIAPLVIGTIGQQVSWHLGFALAAAGMAVGLGIFLLGTRNLSPISSVVPKPLAAGELSRTLRRGLLVAGVLAVCYLTLTLSGHLTLAWGLVPLAVAGFSIPFVVLLRIRRDPELTAPERSRVGAYIRLFTAAVVFWMIYDQGASTMAIFGATHTDNHLFGFEFPTSWFQSANSFWVLLTAPLFAAIWPALARRRKEPSVVVKFAIGLVLIGASFLVFAVPMATAGDGVRVSPLWLIGIYLIQCVGELCLSPVGLAMTSRTAPAKYASLLMGLWFLAVTAGDCAAALLVQAGAHLDTTPVVLAEAVLAIVVGAVVVSARGRILGLMNAGRTT
ncbi:peptide MFS transporter (plasmid) [Streptomyces sp. BI20]|uniref:peptide MFS transporter n=1 Tax=Streptomyces sp. BI20 TaxID=3403460 RepID=UPI003C77FEE7